MILKNYYWCFSKAVPPETCKKIIKTGKKSILKKGTVGAKGEPGDVRKSKVTFLNDNDLFNLVGNFVTESNKNAKWDFQWDWIEPIQFTSYNKKEYYGWHADGFPEPMKKKDINFNGKIRKLSFILQLTDPKKYTGGELRFSLPGVKKNISKPKIFLPQGSVIVFPSFIQHEVTPVKTGNRYSLVSWCIGQPWR
tara:strand:+ start:5333 stop:5914 length:582 start_codon:yes stop_codon:yes gene_type:complete